MRTENIKLCIAEGVAGREPSDEVVAAALDEAVDVLEVIASSLERIATAADRISLCARDNGLNPDTFAFRTA